MRYHEKENHVIEYSVQYTPESAVPHDVATGDVGWAGDYTETEYFSNHKEAREFARKQVQTDFFGAVQIRKETRYRTGQQLPYPGSHNWEWDCNETEIEEIFK